MQFTSWNILLLSSSDECGTQFILWVRFLWWCPLHIENISIQFTKSMNSIPTSQDGKIEKKIWCGNVKRKQKKIEFTNNLEWAKERATESTFIYQQIVDRLKYTRYESIKWFVALYLLNYSFASNIGGKIDKISLMKLLSPQIVFKSCNLRQSICFTYIHTTLHTHDE